MEEDRHSRFTVDLVRRDGVAVVAVRGEIDVSTAPELRDVLHAAIDDGARMEVDLRHVTFMDSTGLAVLVDAHRRLGPAHEAIVLRDPQPPVMRVLRVSGLDGILDVRNGSNPAPAGADDQRTADAS